MYTKLPLFFKFSSSIIVSPKIMTEETDIEITEYFSSFILTRFFVFPSKVVSKFTVTIALNNNFMFCCNLWLLTLRKEFR